MDWFAGLHPVAQAVLATLFTWSVTALGATPVFFARTFNRKAYDVMLGVAAGVMIAASFWSLLAPAIELSARLDDTPWIADTDLPTLGVMAGFTIMMCLDVALG